MASICYLSRTDGRHDAFWVGTLRTGGHRVSAYVVADIEALQAAGRSGGFDLVVAGPLTDAAWEAVRFDIAPVLGLSWGFDLLLEIEMNGARDRLRHVFQRLAGLHVDSQSLATVAQELGMAADRISTAPWGIDTRLFCPGPASVDETTGWSRGDLVVLSTRSWEPMYDIATVLHGFAQAKEKLPELRLVLAGQGSQERAVRSLIHELGISQDTHTPGVLPAQGVLDWLRRSALYVSASHSDGTSLSLLEALAVGVPCVVSDLPTNREWVISQDIGQLFEVGDARSLAAAVTHQLGGPLLDESARARRGLVLARGDWSKNRQVFLASVEQALQEPA